jgi:hypothetical protein
VWLLVKLAADGVDIAGDPRFVGLKTIQLDNAFDQGTYVESHKAIFPTLGPRHYIIARGVDREDSSNDNGQIILVSRSVRTDAAAPRGSTKGQMDVSGWLIEDHNDRSVKVTHVGQIDVKETVLPVIDRILSSEIALAPHKVAEFVNDVGHAPFFVRWGEGPAQLESDSEGDLTTGHAVFRIGGEGTGTMANGQQKCWLQWSERMYERGINVHLEPAVSPVSPFPIRATVLTLCIVGRTPPRSPRSREWSVRSSSSGTPTSRTEPSSPSTLPMATVLRTSTSMERSSTRQSRWSVDLV